MMTMMKKTREFNHLLGRSLTQSLNTLAYVHLKLLSLLAGLVRFFVRINALQRLELYLHNKARQYYGRSAQLKDSTYDEIEEIETLIPVPDDSSVVLTGTLYLPKQRQGRRFPAILVRTPYDRNSPFLGRRTGELFAERGYACMVQDTRGRFGSGGDFFPVVHEVNDGATTVAWLREQPWSNGKVGTYGVSYLGMTSYASAKKESVDACVPVMAASRLYPVLFHGGNTFAFDLIVRWLWLVMNLMQDANPLRQMYKVFTVRSQLETALHPAGEVPIHHRDQDVVGKELHFYRDVYNAKTLEHEFWEGKDELCDLTDGTKRPPLTIVAGWYDFFIKQSFEDFLAASKSSPNTPLKFICRSWSHWDFTQYAPVGLHAAFDLFEAKLLSDQAEYSSSNKPHELILHVIHSETAENPHGDWLKLHSWPPQETRNAVFALQANGALAQEDVQHEGFTTNVYDPEDPTPHLGGMSFDWSNSGRMLQNELEKREDVAVFTTLPLAHDLTLVGNVRLTLDFESNNAHTDLFLKLCDVDALTGNSINVLEHILRLNPASTRGWEANKLCRVEIDMGPTAAMFQQGHCVRLQVSGGAHPAYLRHPGIEDHTSTKLAGAQRKIFHTSTLHLPVFLAKQQ